MMWGCKPHAQPPIWKTRLSLVWLLPLDLSGMGDPTSSYAPAGIALRVSGVLKSHRHDKVETPSVWLKNQYIIIKFIPAVINGSTALCLTLASSSVS
jgi:hypothetical protein